MLEIVVDNGGMWISGWRLSARNGESTFLEVGQNSGAREFSPWRGFI